MGKYNSLHNLFFQIWNYFLKPSILFSVKVKSSPLQIEYTISSGSFVRPDVFRVSQLLTSDQFCWKDCNLRHISSSRVKICVQVASEREKKLWKMVRAHSRTKKSFVCSATFQKNCVFALKRIIFSFTDKDCHTYSKPLPKELDPKHGKVIIRKINGTDIVELNQLPYPGFSTFSDSWLFKLQLKKTKLTSL